MRRCSVQRNARQMKAIWRRGSKLPEYSGSCQIRSVSNRAMPASVAVADHQNRHQWVEPYALRCAEIAVPDSIDESEYPIKHRWRQSLAEFTDQISSDPPSSDGSSTGGDSIGGSSDSTGDGGSNSSNIGGEDGSDEGGKSESTAIQMAELEMNKDKFRFRKEEKKSAYDMTPKEMIAELDKFVIGQAEAKRAMSVAWRARWRRRRIPDEFKPEVTPKNILMIGPTGCGKTEVARRLAKLSDSPFVKVEATKFTEVGYVGKDVNTIIEDLISHAAVLVKDRKRKELEVELSDSVNEILLKSLMGKLDDTQKEYWKKQLELGNLDEMNVEIEVPKDAPDLSFMFGGPSSGSGGNRGGGGRSPFAMFSSEQGRTEKKMCPVKRAKDLLIDQELKKHLSESELSSQALELGEKDGIVFIDEIDKICGSRDTFRGDRRVSQEGVQRDLLPLIEGCQVNVPNYGKCNTDHILFICAGAFHDSKPSDLMPEFQGRLPVRVELKALTEDEMHRILTDTQYNLPTQQVEMIKTEGANLEFTADAIKEMARVAVKCNESIENIGARRLITVMEKLMMEEINMEASEEESAKEYKVDLEYVQDKLKDIHIGEDYEKFIL